MKAKFGLFGLIICVCFSCTDKKQEVKVEKETVQKEISTPAEKEKKAVKTIIDSTEIKLKAYMVNQYVKNDMEFLTEADHKFQYENIDLNGDTIPETFVRFSSPYYCGSGGCTFLLLDNKQKVITKFTVMEAPIFVEKTIKNGWSILLVKDRGVCKELAFNGKKYPSNPSVLSKAPYDAPSGHAIILFEKEFSESKLSVF